jgi:flagellar operon protein
MASGPILYPSVTSLPSAGGAGAPAKNKPEGKKGEFDKVLDQALQPGTAGKLDDKLGELGAAKAGLKFSAHASQRLKDRKIALDQTTMAKVTEAVDKAEAKGVQDTLVLAGDAALIVNVPNRTVVTAMDRGSMSGNVFTNIDGAVVV